MTPPGLALPGKPRPATRVSASPVPASARRSASRRPGPAARFGGSASARIRPRLAFDHVGERVVTVAYEAHRPAARASRPATAIPTLVLGGISAGRHLGPASFDATPGWWPGLVGRGAALDPARQPLIGFDYLGGTDDTGRCLRPVTTHDQARAIAAVLDHLGIAQASFVGASYGGMVALAFAELFPGEDRAADHPVRGPPDPPHGDRRAFGAAGGGEGWGSTPAIPAAGCPWRARSP